MLCGQYVTASVADWFERAALGASILCLVHCVGLPLLLVALPVLSRLVALPESFHIWVLVFAVPTSGVALFLGLKRHHVWLPLATGVLGILLLFAGVLVFPGGPLETRTTVAGSVFLAMAHVMNWRLRHQFHRHG